MTIQNAEFAYGSNTKNARGGALVGDMRGGSIENCHVDSIKFVGYQKVGGLVGFLSKNSDNGTNISIKNCSVKNATFAACGADDEYLYQTGGLIGYIQLGNRNISISNCSVEDIVYDNSKYRGVYNDASDNMGYLSHTFVGIIFSDTNNAANTLSFTDNTISGTKNTPLNASMYGSAYFGWARNPEYKPEETVTLGKITIDGQEWTPNYPFKNVTTGKGYVTLDAALTALKASETLEIWEAGEYTELVNIPANSTLEGKVSGVVFKYTSPGNSENWIAKCEDNATVKNVKWVLTKNDNYQLMRIANVVGCTIEGRIYPHGTMVFTDCDFNPNGGSDPGYEYAVVTWGSDATFNACRFNTRGKAVQVYGKGGHTYTFDGCTFNATNIPQGKGKAGIFVQDGRDTDAGDETVIIKNCTANYERPYDQLDTDPQLSASVLWNVEKGNLSANCDVKVTLDGNLVYANDAVLAISTPAQLKNFADAVNAGKSFEGLTVFLANDIDLAGETVTPIGTGNNKFSGTFDGKNKTIKKFVINNPEADDQGLFGPVFGATIKNLTIIDGQVTGKERVGALVGTGYMYVDNVTVDGCTVNGSEQAGGIAGFISSGSIKNCNINATITGATRAGGVVGKCQADNHFAIDGNTVKGTITSTAADGNYTAGGIACQIMWGQGSSIKNNVIDADIICAGQKSNCPIGDYRAGGSYADMDNGIVGNKWTKSKFTANQDSYTFIVGKPDGVDAVTTLNAAE